MTKETADAQCKKINDYLDAWAKAREKKARADAYERALAVIESECCAVGQFDLAEKLSVGIRKLKGV